MCPQKNGTYIQRYQRSITGVITVGNKTRNERKNLSHQLLIKGKKKKKPKQEFQILNHKGKIQQILEKEPRGSYKMIRPF